jgi:hydroxymethylpyrimidine/phosphomethylpyrimidine kinase
MEACARALARECSAVLLKGGHLGRADDLLFFNGNAQWLRGAYIPCGETHGTGCTLSSAIACNLALGYGLAESCARAKAWLAQLLANKPDFGVPNGPLDVRC